MSKVCQICDKKKATGNKVSHSNRKTRRTFLPNLQKVKIIDGGKLISIRACSKCIKSIGKKK